MVGSFTRCAIGSVGLAVALVLVSSIPPVAGGEMKAVEGRAMARSKYSFDETVSKIKQAIEGQQMMVIQSIDQQAMLQMVGVQAKGMQSILFFHPRYGKAIYEGDRMAGIEAPLKIVVMEGEMGTMISYYKPSHVLAKYPKLKALGRELDGVVKKIEQAVTE
jgi:uncharacterized protein (DUF302 family)